MRRTCLDYDIPVITNIKCSKLFISSLIKFKENNFEYKSWNEYMEN